VRAGHTATLLASGKVLIAGGGGFAALASTELYDPTTGGFTTVGNILTDREQHTATLLVTGEVLIAGGWNGHAADAADDPPCYFLRMRRCDLPDRTARHSRELAADHGCSVDSGYLQTSAPSH
jgi:hypothetical protein